MEGRSGRATEHRREWLKALGASPLRLPLESTLPPAHSPIGTSGHAHLAIAVRSLADAAFRQPPRHVTNRTPRRPDPLAAAHFHISGCHRPKTPVRPFHARSARYHRLPSSQRPLFAPKEIVISKNILLRREKNQSEDPKQTKQRKTDRQTERRKQRRPQRKQTE